MALVLLVLTLIAGLVIIPFGLPGTIVIFAAALGYHILVPAGGVGIATVVGVGIITFAAEVLEWVLSSHYTRRYGGSRRAGWGAIGGGVVGAFIGIPLPVAGSVIGAFLGSFVGAFVAELSVGGGHAAATRVAWGALVGRVVSVAMKIALGIAAAVWIVAAALF
jgi:uncharacterized protein